MLREHVVLEDGVRFELFFASPSNYRLACLRGNRLLVEYSNARPYAFKSVEKLRYDFERDAENAQHQG
jgi:hypothetical protein